MSASRSESPRIGYGSGPWIGVLPLPFAFCGAQLRLTITNSGTDEFCPEMALSYTANGMGRVLQTWESNSPLMKSLAALHNETQEKASHTPYWTQRLSQGTGDRALLNEWLKRLQASYSEGQTTSGLQIEGQWADGIKSAQD